jgi:hypothetical protein
LSKKKLGDLSPPTTQEEAIQFEFYAQHFERPLTNVKMDALSQLIEAGQQKTRRRGASKTKWNMEIFMGSQWIDGSTHRQLVVLFDELLCSVLVGTSSCFLASWFFGLSFFLVALIVR